MADKEEQPQIEVTSYGQQGGITAGIVNIAGVPFAQVEYSVAEYEHTDEGYLTRFQMKIVSQYVIPKLEVTIDSATLLAMRVNPLGSGLFSYSKGEGAVTSGPRTGNRAHKYLIDNVSGVYAVEVVTERKDEVPALYVGAATSS